MATALLLTRNLFGADRAYSSIFGFLCSPDIEAFGGPRTGKERVLLDAALSRRFEFKAAYAAACRSIGWHFALYARDHLGLDYCDKALLYFDRAERGSAVTRFYFEVSPAAESALRALYPGRPLDTERALGRALYHLGPGFRWVIQGFTLDYTGAMASSIGAQEALDAVLRYRYP